MRDESGQIAGFEALPFGVLVFVGGMLLVANVWGVVDAKSTVDAAAREATRAYVEAPSSTDANSTAMGAARLAVSAMGRDAGRLGLRMRAAAGFVRCGTVSADATYAVPSVSLPWVGAFGRGFRVTGHHTEVVDPLRARVPGTAGCVRAP